MKKIITITILIITIIFIILYFNYDLEIESIRQLNFNNETNELTIEIIKKNNIFNKKYKCILYNETNNISVDGNDKCIITFKVGENYNLILKDKLKESKNYKITDYLDNNLEFKFKYETPCQDTCLAFFFLQRIFFLVRIIYMAEALVPKQF